jgi:type II secretory pathway pseudopilin PulG
LQLAVLVLQWVFSMAPHPKEEGVALVELVLVVAIGLIIAAMAVPTFISTRRNFRAIGDARDIASEILLAKMRAASDFTQARVRFNTAANNGFPADSFQIELWDKTGATTFCGGNPAASPATFGTPCWYIDAPTGTLSLSGGITLGSGPQPNPPPGTQAAIAQGNSTAADANCYTGPSGTTPGTQIANTACTVFNSRGIPVDHSGAPTSNDAIYITDTVGVYAATLSATGLLQTWRIDAGDTNAAHWVQR